MLQYMKKAQNRTPTTGELYALALRARHERARCIAALARSLYTRAMSAVTAKVVRHA